jgi:hypothetical protein
VSALKVHPLSEGGPIVGGTLDEAEARAALVRYFADEGYAADEAEAETWAAQARVSVIGHWRWGLCVCGEDHRRDIHDAKPGRGAFPGVMFA